MDLKLGDVFGGGVVIDLREDGTGTCISLIDISDGIRWNTSTSNILQPTGADSLYDGYLNTEKIILAYGDGSYAAKICDELSQNGHSDWYMPSFTQLRASLVSQRKYMGLLSENGAYWTSSEVSLRPFNAYRCASLNGDGSEISKVNTHKVRAVREFNVTDTDLEYTTIGEQGIPHFFDIDTQNHTIPKAQLNELMEYSLDETAYLPVNPDTFPSFPGGHVLKIRYAERKGFTVGEAITIDFSSTGVEPPGDGGGNGGGNLPYQNILNPNEPLRAAYVSKIKAALGTIPVWAKKLPKDKPNADQYVLIMSQTKRRTEEYKSLGEEPLVANKFEWLCTINIDINNINQAGFAKPMNNDNVEETIINAIQSGITVPGFRVKSYDFIDSNDLDVETATQSIERRVITYQHWLCQE